MSGEEQTRRHEHPSSFTLSYVITPLVAVSLYGGAITAMLPACWRDVSEVRQVPDHQEVWQDVSARAAAAGEPPSVENLKISVSSSSSSWLSKTDTNTCVIFEILERQVEVSDDDAASFFFSDLAESNDAAEATTSWKCVFPTAEILPKVRERGAKDRGGARS